jgi:GNAT superfamily N-acetyltransferase
VTHTSIQPGDAGLASKVQVKPLTMENWSDLVCLFGKHGACGGCWCMWWRLKRSEYGSKRGKENKRALKKLAEARAPLGVLVYIGKRPLGWCAIAPREDLPILARSRVLKPPDKQRVWSITCLFIARPYRRLRLTAPLMAGALDFARARGARIVEAYPIDPRRGRIPEVFAFVGVPAMFRKAGFEEVARRSATRPIMRCILVPQKVK